MSLLVVRSLRMRGRNLPRPAEVNLKGLASSDRGVDVHQKVALRENEWSLR
ncbi:MAG TPA: hypothetical protein VLE94_19045 [Burkholderiaceae bacterium]|nr:hypothetical protein [Burkholderiaceae bacterium]